VRQSHFSATVWTGLKLTTFTYQQYGITTVQYKNDNGTSSPQRLQYFHQARSTGAYLPNLFFAPPKKKINRKTPF